MKNTLNTASLCGFAAGSALYFQPPINQTDSKRQLTASGGLLAASVMILDTVWRTAQRTGGDTSPAILMSAGLKVSCPSLAVVRPSPPAGSLCQSDGSFPTNVSLSVTSGDCINPGKALLVFIWLCLMEATQEAMFIFSDQKNKKQRKTKKG